MTRVFVAASVAALGLWTSSAHAAGDPAAGAAAYPARCGGCHQVGATASLGSGPLLKGVAGRKIASLADFTYSPALKAKGGTWTDAELDAFLSSPVKFAPGGKMFSAVIDAKDRANLIAYLHTLK